MVAVPINPDLQRWLRRNDMNRLATAIAILLVVGCASTKTDTQLMTPEEVCVSFVTEVSALAQEHVELAEFPKYAETCKVRTQLYFCKNILPIHEKRLPRPTDFKKHGILLKFELIEKEKDGTSAEGFKVCRSGQTIIDFPSLNLKFYSTLVLWEGAPPELIKEFTDIMERHKAMLSELDKNAANKHMHGMSHTRRP
jgi:hypothetical protein